MNIHYRRKKCVYRLLLLAILLLATACREPLMHNLKEVEANTIVMHLHAAGVTAQKESQPDGKWSIVVAQTDVVRAMQTLNERRLLRKAPPNNNKSSSMLASREEQKLQFERTLSSEMEYTLTTMPGVLDARVHLNLPERDPLLGEVLDTQSSASASVLLVHEDGAKVDELDVRRLVSGASGIPVDKIAVLNSVANMQHLVPSQVAPIAGSVSQSALTGYLGNSYQLYLSIVITIGALIYLAFVLRRMQTRKKLSSVEKALHASESLPVGVSL